MVPIRVGAGALDLLARDLAARANGRAFVVSDANVAALHGERLCRALRAQGVEAELLVFPAGEASKTRETKAVLEDELLRGLADERRPVQLYGRRKDSLELRIGHGENPL